MKTMRAVHTLIGGLLVVTFFGGLGPANAVMITNVVGNIDQRMNVRGFAGSDLQENNDVFSGSSITYDESINHRGLLANSAGSMMVVTNSNGVDVTFDSSMSHTLIGSVPPQTFSSISHDNIAFGTNEPLFFMEFEVEEGESLNLSLSGERGLDRDTTSVSSAQSLRLIVDGGGGQILTPTSFNSPLDTFAFSESLILSAGTHSVILSYGNSLSFNNNVAQGDAAFNLSFNFTADFDQNIPEPSTLALFLIALGGLSLMMRRRLFSTRAFWAPRPDGGRT